MKITVAILLLSALCNAEQKATSRSKQKTEEKSNKRELVEGNAGVEKRASVFSTVSPSVTPGIEYADSKENERDKSPSQQNIYSAPVSAIAKISDLLSSQGPSFPTAIASHLYAPVSAYQARISPTYEVSAPVPSRLAYSEKITYRPNVEYQPRNQNSINQPQQKLFVRYNNPQPQQVLVQPLQNQQQVFQQIPQYHQNQAPLFQSYQAYPQNQIQQIYQSLQAPPGIVYARDNVEKTVQRAEKPQAIVVNEIKQQTPNRNYNSQPQTAVSYASFSQNQPEPHAQTSQYQPQQQQNAYQQPTAPQLQPTGPQSQPTAPQQPIAQSNQHSAQPIQQPIYQPAYQQQIFNQIPYQQPTAYQQPISIQVPQTQYHIESQNYQAQNYQPQLQYRPPVQQARYQLPALNLQYQKPQEPAAKQTGNLAGVLLKSGPLEIQNQPQLTAPSFQNPEVFVLNNGFGLAVPTFPPVQYFGKFAQSIFGNYQH